MEMKNKTSKTREMLVDEYIKALEQEQLPWHQDWVSNPPHNAITKTPYRMCNKVLLYHMQKTKHYEDSRWCTVNQAEANEWYVKKGEKSVPLEFYYYYNRQTKQSMKIKEFTDWANKIKSDPSLSLEEKKQRIEAFSLMCSSFNVFNVNAQMEHRHYIKDGCEYVKASEYYRLIKEIKKDKKASFDEKKERFAELKERYELVCEKIEKEEVPTIEYNSNQVVDSIINNLGVDYEEIGDKAFYNPKDDKITMPPMTTFHTEYGYYATKLHESCHATGHPNRLNRDMSGLFGSQKYAMEELRAEIGSSFLMAELGLQADENHINNHKAYIQSWISELKKDPKVLFDAIKDADKIVDYIREKGEFEMMEEHSEVQEEQEDEEEVEM